MIEDIPEKIKKGGIGILPTDTIYGIAGAALDKEAYQKIIRLKNRSPEQKLVILVASWQQLQSLGVVLSSEQKTALAAIWPGPVTAVLDAPRAPDHLRAFDGTVAVRWPNKPETARLVEQAGPIIATSANISGEPFLNSLAKIKKEFPGLDFYVSGDVSTEPSQISRILKDGSIKQIR